MKNYVQSGETLTLTAPYDVASGAGMLVGSLFAIATAAALSGATVECRPGGVYDLVKNTGEAWTAGAKIYWDNTNKRCTTTSSANTLIGVATQAQASSDAIGRVKLGIVA